MGANLRDGVRLRFQSLNALLSLVERTSRNSVRSDFYKRFQCPEFQPRQNFAPCFQCLQWKHAPNQQEAQWLGLAAGHRVGMTAYVTGAPTKALMTNAHSVSSLGRDVESALDR